ncbi:MAG: glycosyltransferase family 1 protein [Patescibacteria group bacterium]
MSSRKLRIAFDASCLVDNHKSGVARYTEALITNLAKDYGEVELVGHYCNFLGRCKNLELPQAPNISYRPTRLLPAKVLNLLRRLRLPIPFELLIKGRADFHLFPAFIGWPSLFKTPSAPVIYDLTYLDFPEVVSKRARHDLVTFVPKAIKRAKFVITISEVSALSLRKHYGLTEQDIVVTHIPSELAKRPSEAVAKSELEKLNISQPFILFLGNLEPRKNLLTLLAAYKSLEPGLQERFALVVAGGKGWHDDAILSELDSLQKAGTNIIQTGYVTDGQRAALFETASIFVLPSLYEGFGMTLLEAMSYDVPVIASDIAIFREVCGDAALYFDSASPHQLAQQLKNLLSDARLQSKLIAGGKTNLKRFSWQQNTNKIYKRIGASK